MTCLRQAGRVGARRGRARRLRAGPWNDQGGRGYAAGMTEAPVPVPMRAVEQADGRGVAFAGYEAFAAALDQ
jgi:hypothetical protein